MDRRSFLLNSAALAVTAATSELGSAQSENPMAPPVESNASHGNRAPFTWREAGLVFEFEFLGDSLRLRGILPVGAAEPMNLPPPTGVSGLEASIHCTGEDVSDHHGAKFKKLLDYIRSKGMVPGIWIEPEVAGLQTALAHSPDSWFFRRHGKRVIDHSRYQLDFRNPDVRAYIDATFDRLIGDYGIGYIKLDYNINALEGTDWRADSFGQGLLGHNRAFLAWLDSLLDRNPELTLETVASGGMRMEYSMLSRSQLQSISDQDDYRMYASITTGCSAALLPEQMGVWSQPLEHDTPEAASCNMVNAMLGRIHQSGFLPRLSQESLAQIHNGIAIYKREIRRHVPESVPFYPLGMPDITSPGLHAALGMRAPDRQFLAVWRRAGPTEVRVPGCFPGARLLYPDDLGIGLAAEPKGLSIRFPSPDMACIVAASPA